MYDPDVAEWIQSSFDNKEEPPPVENKVVPVVVPVEKKWVHVEAHVDTLRDLIHLAEEATTRWDYLNPGLEFSVDLARLVSILPEMREIDSMVGLASFKKSVVAQILYYLQGLDRNASGEVIDYRHMVLCGAPGVGKTEIAKIVSRLFLSMGVLTQNVFKKATRSDLVGGYLGQTAIKTAGVIQSCLGGVLFIDEAYSLWDMGKEKQDAYAREAIDTLCEAMSHHRGELMVIIAGYQEEIEAFLEANRGLDSRFLWRHVLETYSAKELCHIFLKLVKEAGWTLHNSLDYHHWFEKHRSTFVGNGRDMEKLLTFCKITHAKRMFGNTSLDDLKSLTEADLNSGYSLFQTHQAKGKEKTMTTHQFYFV